MSRVRTVVATEVIMLLGLAAFILGAMLIQRGFVSRPLALGPLGEGAFAATPALLWLGYFYAQDRHEPEPKHYVFGVFLVAAFLAGPICQLGLDTLLAQSPAAPPSLDPLAPDRLVRAILVVGLSQELCKYAVVRYSVYRTAEFDEPLDGIVYASAAGLGFATYLTFRYLDGAGGRVFLAVAAERAVVTSLAHACFGAVTGYFLGRAKFSSRGTLRRGLYLLAGLGLAALLNGQFAVVDAAVAPKDLSLQPWRSIAFTFGFAVVVLIAVSLLARRLLRLSPHRPLEAPAVAAPPPAPEAS